MLQVYSRLGLSNLKVHLNTVGDKESRATFRNALIDFLKPHFQNLSADSQTRFAKNPLRILDSKDPKDREILKNAPSILNSLNQISRDHFQELKVILDRLHIPYCVDDKIVRGLDYYNKTVFEIISEDLGAQGTIGAGGRYDGLIKQFGGPDLPGVGFATGIERLLQAMIKKNALLPKDKRPQIFFIPLGDEAQIKALELATLCRHQSIATGIELHAKKIQAALQNANRSNAIYCAIIGSDELRKGSLQLKHLETRETKEIPFEEFLSFLKRELSHIH